MVPFFMLFIARISSAIKVYRRKTIAHYVFSLLLYHCKLALLSTICRFLWQSYDFSTKERISQSLKSPSFAPLISRYILRLGQAAQKQQHPHCLNCKMYLDIRRADEWLFKSALNAPCSIIKKCGCLESRHEKSCKRGLA